MTPSWKVGDRCVVKFDEFAEPATQRLMLAHRQATVTGVYPEPRTANVQFDKGRARLPHHALVKLDQLAPAGSP